MTIGGDQWSVTYELVAPDGSRAVFNDDTDPDYVGMATWSGLDDSEVREVADDRTEADGGVHGNFWRGRRPVVGKIEIAPASTTDANTRYDKMMRAANCVRGDSILTWTPDGSAEQFLRVRKSGPVRRAEDSAWLRKYTLPLVSADSYKYSTELHRIDETDPTVATNAGSAESPPVIVVEGPADAVSLTNTTSGKSLTVNSALSSGETLSLDFGARTVLKNGVTNVYDVIDGVPEWWMLQPGDNAFSFTDSSTSLVQKDGGTFADDASGGGAIAWGSVANATAHDAAYAVAGGVGSGNSTHYLRGSNYGFAVPSTATILGIEVGVWRLPVFASGYSFVRDHTVRLVDASGTVVGTNKADTVNIWSPGVEVQAVYGGPDDLWGSSWTYADINDIDFGVALAVEFLGTSVYAAVNSMYIRVTYQVGSVLSSYAVSWRDAWL